MNVIDGTARASSLESLLAAGWKPVDATGFIELVGPMLSKQEGDAVRYGFFSAPKHENRRGVVHGGMIATFADRALAMTSRRANDDLPQATIDLSVRYVDAVQVGEFVEAVCEVVRKTRSVIFVRATFTAGSRVVATADGIWKVLVPKRALVPT
jgi:uncharacterized protein (TIGR00369 family)